MTQAKIQLVHEWTAVLLDGGVPYRFPLPLKQSGPHKHPAVYRWLPFLHAPGDVRRVYVGQCANLARRVYGYLNPNPAQKTNDRMRSFMDALLVEGYHVQLDVLRIDHLEIDGDVMPPGALKDRELRRLVENWMVWRHRREGFEVLNASGS